MIESLYTSDSHLHHPRAFLSNLLADLPASAGLGARLLARNLRAHYRQSLLGYVWLLLNPLALAAIWIFLRAANVLSFPETSVPYPVYVVTGLFLWQGFVKMLNMPLQHLTSSRPLLARVKFPWEAVLLAGVGEVLFEFALYLAVLVGVFLAFGIEFRADMLWGLPALAVWLSSGLALGLLLTPWGMLYDDVSRGLSVLTSILFFLIPIVYSTPSSMPGVLLVTLNPLAILFVVARDTLMTGQSAYATAFLIITALVTALFVASWVMFRLAIPHLVSRLAN
jgi:lipopolysaccharide transport system permease protein